MKSFACETVARRLARLILLTTILFAVGVGGLILMPPARTTLAAPPVTAATQFTQTITLQNSPGLTPVAQIGLGTLSQAAWSPSGDWLALGGSLGVYLFEAETLTRQHRLATPNVNRLEFSADGRTLLAANAHQVDVWDVARRQIHHSRQITSTDRFDTVSLAALSRDGRRFASRFADQPLQIRDSRSGRLLSTLSPTGSLTLSPDLSYVMAVTFDGTTIFETATGQPRFRLDVTRGAMVRHLFIPQTDLLAIATIRDKILLVDLAAGALRHTLSGQDYSRFLAASPNGRWLAAGGNDDTVQVWDVADGTRHQTFTAQPYSYGLAFSPDGERLAIGSQDHRLTLWDVASGRAMRRFRGHTSGISRLWISPNEQYLAAEDLVSIKIWEVETGRLRRSFDKEPPADFLVTGGQVIVPRNDRTAVWQWGDGVISPRLTLTGTAPLAVSRNGQNLITTRPDHQAALVWIAISDSPLQSTLAFSQPLLGLALSPNGSLLATSAERTSTVSNPSANSLLSLWDVASGQQLAAIETQPYSVRPRQFLSDNFLETSLTIPDSCGRGGGISATGLWSIEALRQGETEPLRVFQGHGAVWSANREIVATVSQSRVCLRPATVRVWDAASGDMLLAQPYDPNYVAALAITPDGETVAIALNDGTLEWREGASGQVYKAYVLAASATSLRYSPDGQFLAVGYADGTIQFYSAANYEPGYIFAAHQGAVTGLKFSTDVTLLVSGSSDGTVKLWGLR